VKGVGPKTALKLLRSHGRLESIPEFRSVSLPVDVSRIRGVFLSPEVTSSYAIEWKPPDVEGVVAFLCGERDFSEVRVRKAMDRIAVGSKEMRSKTTLEKWFG
jgi:flap endonuclease-1